MDVAKHFETIRDSISVLEKHLFHPKPNRDKPSTPVVKTELVEHVIPPSPNKAPGMLGMQGQTGFYTGATSAASHLVTASFQKPIAPSKLINYFQDDTSNRNPTEDHPISVENDYDSDLIDILPKTHILDGLIDYYFEYCNWIYRTVDRKAFCLAWDNFKCGLSPDRLILATVCILTALAIRYLPVGHELLEHLPVVSPHEAAYLELSLCYYDVMKHALRRHQDETKVYTLELVELLLARCQYLTYAKTDPEEIWAVRGELMTIGTAMGLHRDPGKSRFSKDVAERRRWAWWHIYLLER